jgi:cation-transporting P-type ATPase 13A2
MSHDYTEGASAVDINDAVAAQRRARRDSRHSTFYGEQNGSGSVFDGPGHVAIPSSVSRMNRNLSQSFSRRASMDRRRSTDIYAISVTSGEGGETDGEGEDEGRRGRDGTPRSPTRGMFESFTNIFTGRHTAEPTAMGGRRSRSRRSSLSSRTSRSRAGSVGADEQEEERWGYASGEEEEMSDMDEHEEVDFGSYPPSPDASLPMLATDAVFGRDEARIDIELDMEPLEAHVGPPSRQDVYVHEEDSHVRFFGYETVLWRQWLWRVACVVSFGILGLLGHWFPRFWLRWVAREKAFKHIEHGFIVIEVGVYLVNCSHVVQILKLGKDRLQGYCALSPQVN